MKILKTVMVMVLIVVMKMVTVMVVVLAEAADELLFVMAVALAEVDLVAVESLFAAGIGLQAVVMVEAR